MENKKNYVWPVTNINKAAMDSFVDYVKNNETKFRDKKIAIFGAGIKGNEYLLFLQKLGYKDFVFIDNNQEKQGGYIEKYPICSLEEFMEQYDNYVIFIAVESGDSLKKQLEMKGLVEEQDFYYFRPKIHQNFITAFQRKCELNYLFFGDCEFTSVSIHDIQDETLSEMVIQKFGADNTKVLAMHGMGIRAYYNILRAQTEYGILPKKVVLEVNPLTFTKTRHLLPRTQHVGLLEQVMEISPNDELGEYIEEAKRRFNNFQSDFFVNRIKSKEESQNEESLKAYIKLNYMYKFNENIEGIVYLKKMIQFCRLYKINIGLFIPPANYMLAEKFFGQAFWEKYDLIRNGVRSVIEKEQESVVDYSKLLNENQFCAKETPDETANYEGRKLLLEHLYKDFGD